MIYTTQTKILCLYAGYNQCVSGFSTPPGTHYDPYNYLYKLLNQSYFKFMHMQQKVLCYWVNYRECRFKDTINTMPKPDFLKEYCTYCLQGQLIELLFDLTHKFDNI